MNFRRKLFSKKICIQSLFYMTGYVLISILSTLFISFNDAKTSENDCLICLTGPTSPDNALLVAHLKKNYLQEPSSLAYNLTKDKKYLKQMVASSMVFNHGSLECLFPDTREGFFVEAGALDGQFLSSSLWFEQQRNWTGLLVEPDSDNFRDLKAKNRRAWTSKSCLSTKPFPHEIILKSLKRSVNLPSDIWLFRSNSHDSNFNLITNLDMKGEVEYEYVQCFPLQTYLLALGRKKVDILILDTQGGENLILEFFPFDEIEVTVIVVEHYLDSDKHFDKKFVKMMNKKNYVLFSMSVEPDYIFVKKNHKQLKKFPYFFQNKLDRENILENSLMYKVPEIGNDASNLHCFNH